MTAYENMSREDRVRYEEAHMTHGQRYQAECDWHDFQVIGAIALFVLVLALCLIEPLFI